MRSLGAEPALAVDVAGELARIDLLVARVLFLGALVSASHANDIARTADALAAIVRGCEGCHAMFRAAPSPAP